MQKRSLNLIVTSVVRVLFIKCLRMCRGNGDMGFNRTWYVLILHVAESARFNFSAKRHVRLQPSTIVWYLLCINHVTDQHPWQMLTNRHTLHQESFAAHERQIEIKLNLRCGNLWKTLTGSVYSSISLYRFLFYIASFLTVNAGLIQMWSFPVYYIKVPNSVRKPFLYFAFQAGKKQSKI